MSAQVEPIIRVAMPGLRARSMAPDDGLSLERPTRFDVQVYGAPARTPTPLTKLEYATWNCWAM